MRTVKEVLMQAMEGFIRLETKQSYQRDSRNLIVDLTTTLQKEGMHWPAQQQQKASKTTEDN